MKQTVTFTPWRSIRAGSVGVAPEERTFTGALESPCASCSTAPCCTHLPVHNFRVTHLSDLSYATYLLNFDRIRLGVNRNGDWSVYYVEPCRFLDRSTFDCTVHAKPEQPQICVQYNPYNCWYKRSLTQSVSEEFLQVDRARLEYLLATTTFDETRSIVTMPDWATTAAAFRDLADEPADPGPPPVADAAFTAWRQLVLGPDETDGVPAADADPDTTPAMRTDPGYRTDLSYEDQGDPCTGCSAPCCETITFPHGKPTTKSSLDFFRFCLGFPGVELFVGDDSWWLTIKSRCRHLVDGRCAIYGKPERPLLCKYYDAWKCTFRVEFGVPRPPGGLRIRLEHFPALVETMRFDSFGAVTQLAPVEAVRAHVEQRWRESALR